MAMVAAPPATFTFRRRARGSAARRTSERPVRERSIPTQREPGPVKENPAEPRETGPALTATEPRHGPPTHGRGIAMVPLPWTSRVEPPATLTTRATRTRSVAVGAGEKLLEPACWASMTQVPTPTTWTVPPVTEHA